MEGVEVRPAEERDIEWLVRLAEEFMAGGVPRETRLRILKENLRRSDYVLLVAESGSETIGFVDLWIIEDFVHGSKLGYIQNLYVTPTYRRRGIATSLLTELIKLSRERKVCEIHVVTEPNNVAAVRLYKRCGFIKEWLALEKELMNET